MQLVLCGLMVLSNVCFGMRDEWAIDNISHQEKDAQFYVGTGTVHIAYELKRKGKKPDLRADWTPDENSRNRMGTPMMIVFKDFTTANYQKIQNVKKDHPMYVYFSSSLPTQLYVKITAIEQPSFDVVRRWRDCITLGSENGDSITIYDPINIKNIDVACESSNGNRELFITLEKQHYESSTSYEICRIKEARAYDTIDYIDFSSRVKSFFSFKDLNSFVFQFMMPTLGKNEFPDNARFKNITINLDEDVKAWRWYAACKSMRWGVFAAIFFMLGYQLNNKLF